MMKTWILSFCCKSEWRKYLSLLFIGVMLLILFDWLLLSLSFESSPQFSRDAVHISDISSKPEISEETLPIADSTQVQPRSTLPNTAVMIGLERPRHIDSSIRGLIRFAAALTNKQEIGK